MSSAKSTGPKFRCARTKEILVLYFFIGRKPVSEPEHSGGEHHCGATSQEKAKPKASSSKKRATPKSEAPALTTIHLYHQTSHESINLYWKRMSFKRIPRDYPKATNSGQSQQCLRQSRFKRSILQRQLRQWRLRDHRRRIILSVT